VKVDPDLDLVLERVLDVPPALVWAAWTRREHLVKWYATPPWTTVECEIDLRPGGAFRTLMRSPDGAMFPNEACYVEVVPERRLVWTDVLEPDFRPTRLEARMGFRFTIHLGLEPQGSGTKCTVVVMHSDAKSRAKLEAMDFRSGWNKGFDRLVEHMRQMLD
jgi:uncharacterized protein YndB with AHSA1/START domain